MIDWRNQTKVDFNEWIICKCSENNVKDTVGNAKIQKFKTKNGLSIIIEMSQERNVMCCQ